MKNIVWLTEWLPTPAEPYSGDGIERRAKAASLYNDIVIIFVKKKTSIGFNKVQMEERVYNKHCRAFIYYYPSIRKLSRFLDVVVSNYYFIRLHGRAFYDYRKRFGKPAGIQVNVTMKNGIIALCYKWLWNMNYIVVEGWSLFLPEARPQFDDKGWLFRLLTRKVIKNASLLVTVSDHLAKMMRYKIADIPSLAIPSVVDTDIFFPANKIGQRDIFRFVHISSLDYPKNFEQILQAVKIVLENGYKVELVVHGPDRKEIKLLSKELNLQDNILFEKEASQERLAETLRNSDALLLYSRYETFGNVIIEANACGLPVIVSDYPTFNEIVFENVNGLTATGNNPGSLAEKMIYMMKNYSSFDPSAIVKLTNDRYSFRTVGKLFDNVYGKFF